MVQTPPTDGNIHVLEPEFHLATTAVVTRAKEADSRFAPSLLDEQKYLITNKFITKH